MLDRSFFAGYRAVMLWCAVARGWVRLRWWCCCGGGTMERMNWRGHVTGPSPSPGAGGVVYLSGILRLVPLPKPKYVIAKELRANMSRQTT